MQAAYQHHHTITNQNSAKNEGFKTQNQKFGSLLGHRLLSNKKYREKLYSEQNLSDVHKTEEDDEDNFMIENINVANSNHAPNSAQNLNLVLKQPNQQYYECKQAPKNK